MAYNQGFYNLFLAIITLVGLAPARREHEVGSALALAGTGSMLAAALVLVTHDRTMVRAAITQGTLPALAVLFLLLRALSGLLPQPGVHGRHDRRALAGRRRHPLHRARPDVAAAEDAGHRRGEVLRRHVLDPAARAGCRARSARSRARRAAPCRAASRTPAPRRAAGRARGPRPARARRC